MYVYAGAWMCARRAHIKLQFALKATSVFVFAVIVAVVARTLTWKIKYARRVTKDDDPN